MDYRLWNPRDHTEWYEYIRQHNNKKKRSFMLLSHPLLFFKCSTFFSRLMEIFFFIISCALFSSFYFMLAIFFFIPHWHWYALAVLNTFGFFLLMMRESAIRLGMFGGYTENKNSLKYSQMFAQMWNLMPFPFTGMVREKSNKKWMFLCCSNQYNFISWQTAHTFDRGRVWVVFKKKKNQNPWIKLENFLTSDE